MKSATPFHLPRLSPQSAMRRNLLLGSSLLLLPGVASRAAAAQAELPVLNFRGGMWIELSPVIAAAKHFYPGEFNIGTGGVASLTTGEANIATNAETQLLRETIKNPSIRTIMTVTESFYRIVAMRSRGINSLADLKGKRVITPARTSAGYFLVAMLESVGLTESDVTLVPFPRGADTRAAMDEMSEVVKRNEADAVAIWEPEAEDAIHDFGDDAIVFQDKSVYREIFNLYTTTAMLEDPVQRNAIVTYVRAVIDATAALKANPEPYWPDVEAVIGYPVSDIRASWGEMDFPIHIVPDLLDVMVKEDVWVAQELGRAPRTREELAQFVDYSVLEEALLEFPGCAVVISHDRWFLDRIATHILAFEGDSHVEWFAGNFQEYEADKKRRLGTDADQPHRIKYRRLTR